MDLRAKTNLSNRINLIWVVQSFSQKYSGSLLTQITCISLAIPAHTKGRFAIVTNVRWDAMDASGATDESAYPADGEVVWS